MRLFRYLLSLMLVCCATAAAAQPFVTVHGTSLRSPFHEGTAYRFCGTNMWYATLLARKGDTGNRERLHRELDRLQAMGIDNLRILVGADELPGTTAHTVTPCLQDANGRLDKKALEALDYLLAELERRHMVAVLYLNNAWDWSGGYAAYLRRAGAGIAPSAAGETYNDYVAFCSQFSVNEKAQELYLDFVRRIVSRKNRITGKPYAESPAIMAWQVCNEPRPFAASSKRGFFNWIATTARLIKQLDPNHLVSVGSEGYYGCEKDMALFEEIHALPEVDYLTIHLWPVNWGWSNRGALYQALPRVYIEAEKYIDMHVRVARRLNKPLVIEEFGYPRDRNFFTPGTTTGARDGFYAFVMNQWKKQPVIAGLNFWGWAGEGRPGFTRPLPEGDTSREGKTMSELAVWQPGDDLLSDPPHEPQGWYSVFDTDTTTIRILQDR